MINCCRTKRGPAAQACCARSGYDTAPKSEPLKTVPVRRDFKLHRMGVASQDMGDLNVEERLAWHRPHRCTDVGTLVVFLAGLCGMVWVVNYGRQHGDVRRLYHGINFHGEMCGVDLMVASMPYLFWCSQPGGVLPSSLSEVLDTSDAIDTNHPICVPECPQDNRTHHQCYQAKHVVPVSKDPLTGTLVENVTYHYRLVRDYATTGVAGHYCMPLDGAMMRQLRGNLEVSAQSAMMRAGEIGQAWAPLAASAALALVLGYLYLFLVGKLVDELIYLFLAVAIVLPIVAGSAMLYACASESQTTEFVERFGWSGHLSRFPSTGEKWLDMGLALLCIAIGLLVGIAACCLRHSVKVLLGVIEASTEALRAMPTLLAAPLLSLLFKAFIFSVEAAGLVLLISCGTVERLNVFQGLMPGGIARKITFDENEAAFIAFFCFMAIWIMELAFALEQFVLAYSVQLWFFKDYEQGRKGLVVLPMVRGLLIAVKYHLGTLALGALLLSLLEALRIALTVIQRQIQDGEGNERCSVSKLLAGCCCCCLSCFECFIRFMNKNAYIVTAVESKPFCVAAQLALSVVANEFVAVGMLSAALAFFMAIGFISITSLGAFLTWVLLHTVDSFQDPTSKHFVANPEVITGVAALIAALVAGTFMVMFHTVADAMIFCWALDRKYREEHGLPPGNNVPWRLKELMEKEDCDLLMA